jgi:S-adenosylmethionine hydrolase
MSPTIALLTDFGTTDHYVGVMKAVMARICPDAGFIDITHAILPQNVRHAAFVLMNTYRYFAPGTVFLVVVDPGVGSVRKSIAIQADDYTFVAPDNGVLSYVLANFPSFTAVELTNPAYRLDHVTHTFHGRDLFAPTTAYLALGTALNKFGPAVESLVQLPPPYLSVESGRIRGEILYADHFGNLVTSIGPLRWSGVHHLDLCAADQIVSFSPDRVVVDLPRISLIAIHRTYSRVPPGEPLALVDSSGYLEVAINQGSAAKRLKLTSGDPIVLQIG